MAGPSPAMTQLLWRAQSISGGHFTQANGPIHVLAGLGPAIHACRLRIPDHLELNNFPKCNQSRFPGQPRPLREKVVERSETG
ncbi:hypothetical protein SAMN05519103_06677 [Rhizobiales bacterium GAS113]|nr:hypothetical protein SAMN05519103_06677 [Rhizobiales bacterium GAS113]